MSLTDLNLLTFDTKLRLGREKNILQWSAAISRALFTLGLHTHSIQHSSHIYFVSHCAAFSKQLVKSLSLFHSLQHINDISLFQRPKSIKKSYLTENLRPEHTEPTPSRPPSLHKFRISGEPRATHKTSYESGKSRQSGFCHCSLLESYFFPHFFRDLFLGATLTSTSAAQARVPAWIQRNFFSFRARLGNSNAHSHTRLERNWMVCMAATTTTFSNKFFFLSFLLGQQLL